jgi:hypothetical protein
MKLPFKPHLLVLLCSTGLFAASGVMFVKSRATEAPAPAVQQPATPAPSVAAPAAQPAPVAAPAYTAAQIDQWVAPIALYPDALLSQILMASTYPANVIQAAQWSKDNPKMQGDAAVQAVAGQPWDPSVKSLVDFSNPIAALLIRSQESGAASAAGATPASTRAAIQVKFFITISFCFVSYSF